jgi:CubicO group peptidase (beta-lactamase class C family)
MRPEFFEIGDLLTTRSRLALFGAFLVATSLAAQTPPPAPPPGDPDELPKGPPISRQEALDEIQREIASRAAADRFDGVVLVAKDGKILLHRAAGLAERSFKVPVGLDTKFNLGSINKMFTRLAILQLQAAGKLSLDAPFGTCLPDYPDQEIASKATLRQLLDMQSGLGDFFNDKFEATPKDRIRNLQDYLGLFAGQPAEFEPGAKRRYSNAGYVVLGLIVEKLSGTTYYDYVQQQIFAPAGMTATGYFTPDEIVADRAVGYTRGGERREPAPSAPLTSSIYFLPGRGSSAGGGYSNAADLLRFAQALHAGKLGGGDFFARNGGLGVAGGAPGTNAVFEDDWETGWTIIVLANLDPPAAEEISRIARGLVARIKD